jgi:hypothetical protein
MKITFVVLLASSLLCTGCISRTANPNNQVLPSEPRMTSVAQNQTVDQFSNAVAESEREYEKMVLHPETVTNLPLSEWPFPNYQSGPLNPRPIHINLYDVNDKYPEYLLCEYDVDEKAYNKIGEHTWIEDALIQIRHHGQKSFPQVEWVVVAINNRAEHRGVSTFEQSFKVGAIFKAGDVFNSLHNLSAIVAEAQLDHHPFKYDPQQPTPGEQQRWVIVERHAAVNRPASKIY